MNYIIRLIWKDNWRINLEWKQSLIQLFEIGGMSEFWSTDDS